MRWGLNLRGDLAKLDTQALGERMDELFEERRVLSESLSDLMTVGNAMLYRNGLGMPFGRGLLHAKPIYAINAFIYGGSHRRGLGRLYMIDCELKDLLDETRRRL